MCLSGIGGQNGGEGIGENKSGNAKSEKVEVVEESRKMREVIIA